MITQVGQIMLYVDDVEKAKAFWTEKVGFVDVSENPALVEIAPNKDAQTRLVLHNRQLIAEQEPELNLGTPSLMFYTDDADELYESFRSKGLTLGDKVPLETGIVFNFADAEGNYFAVMERGKG